MGTCHEKKTFVIQIFSPHNCKLGDPWEEMPGSYILDNSERHFDYLCNALNKRPEQKDRWLKEEDSWKDFLAFRKVNAFPSWPYDFVFSLMQMIKIPAQNDVNQKGNLLAEKWWT